MRIVVALRSVTTARRHAGERRYVGTPACFSHPSALSARRLRRIQARCAPDD